MPSYFFFLSIIRSLGFVYCLKVEIFYFTFTVQGSIIWDKKVGGNNSKLLSSELLGQKQNPQTKMMPLLLFIFGRQFHSLE